MLHKHGIHVDEIELNSIQSFVHLFVVSYWMGKQCFISIKWYWREALVIKGCDTLILQLFIQNVYNDKQTKKWKNLDQKIKPKSQRQQIPLSGISLWGFCTVTNTILHRLQLQASVTGRDAPWLSANPAGMCQAPVPKGVIHNVFGYYIVHFKAQGAGQSRPWSGPLQMGTITSIHNVPLQLVQRKASGQRLWVLISASYLLCPPPPIMFLLFYDLTH